MRSTVNATLLAVCACSTLIGCAQDGLDSLNLLTTASTTTKKKVAAPLIDPACLALQNKISLLQDEGTVSRVEKAASGSTNTVVIKRAALSKVAELNQANDEFRARCSKLPGLATKAPTQEAVTAQVAEQPVKQP